MAGSSSNCESEHRQVDPHLQDNFLDNDRKLSREQAGHLRHFHNLATLPYGQWDGMGSQVPGEEWLDSYRYQLATMAYASGAAHFHRLPALRAPFKRLFEQLIDKMLHPAVWSYWYLTSQSGRFVDPDIESLRRPWPDPVCKENIMYSGHLLLMVSMYTMLFGDEKYDQPGALTFKWNPIFWGMGPEKFPYNRKSLQQAILSQMEAEKWMGVCCEPNSIFVVCNQFPIIAMRYNDVRDGTQIVDEVIPKYVAAWKEKGMIQDNGLMVNRYMPKQDRMVPSMDINFTAWAAAFMNAWNPAVAHETFEKQKTGVFSESGNETISLNAGSVAMTIRNLAQEGADPFTSETRRKAREIVAANPSLSIPERPLPRPAFGYCVKWVSEVGSQEFLDGLLAHGDKYLGPTWTSGGLYYPTQTQKEDSEGNWTEVDRFTGNGAIAYARLNVFDGQRKMWECAWTPQQVLEAPFVDDIDFSTVDFLRCKWDDTREAMIVTLRSWDGTSMRVNFTIRNLPVGQYGLYIGNKLSAVKVITDSGTIVPLSIEVAEGETDVVVKRV